MNTYVVLCTILCLGIFGLGLLASTLGGNLAAHLFARRRLSKRLSANELFAFRIVPFASATLLALGLALPAFLWLEPRRTEEAPDLYLVASACLSLLVIAVIAVRLYRTVSATNRIVREWQCNGTRLSHPSSIPLFRVETSATVFAATGILAPKVFVGRDALACLTREELEAAIEHELAHIRSWDNLKRAILSVTRLPKYFQSLNSIDAVWSQAAEALADEAALNRTSTLALGTAIVKIARLHNTRRIGIAALHPATAISHLVTGQVSTMEPRLARLRDLMQSDVTPAKHRAWSLWLTVACVVLGYMTLLPAALSLTHRIMEDLVK